MKTITLILLSILFQASSIAQDYNPHHGMERLFLTSWDHSKSVRYDIPQRFTNTVNSIQFAPVTIDNPDRPVTSHVLPIIVADKRETNPNNRFRILEDYIYQYRPVSPVDPISRRRYGIAKSFNIRDITQWETHHPTVYVSSLNSEGEPNGGTDFKEDALKLYIKEIDDNGKPTNYTTKEEQKISFYLKTIVEGSTSKQIYTKNKSLSDDGVLQDNLAIPRKLKDETYSVLARFDGRNSITFCDVFSQINYVKFGRLKMRGQGNFDFLFGRDSPKSKEQHVFSFLTTKNPNSFTNSDNDISGFYSFMDFGYPFKVEVTDNQGSTKAEFVRSRIRGLDGYGELKYLKLQSKEEILTEAEVFQDSSGKIYKRIIHNGTDYYERIYKETELDGLNKMTFGKVTQPSIK